MRLVLFTYATIERLKFVTNVSYRCEQNRKTENVQPTCKVDYMCVTQLKLRNIMQVRLLCNTSPEIQFSVV